ncbi:hypothetical protein FOQG_16585 [Fusarium oxysporum f. sp. raphani 54005]|uniref:Uncharacterized protein n=1 Tax=Fusarium oxysporum f. sp. raphani 54005 TaxID=1089458 RepID=X0BAH6_FUSOX|nr:hypothetical protein FOQG_16585 [Fusarium oxysporum f. sp. raphani 54005]
MEKPSWERGFTNPQNYIAIITASYIITFNGLVAPLPFLAFLLYTEYAIHQKRHIRHFIIFLAWTFVTAPAAIVLTCTSNGVLNDLDHAVSANTPIPVANLLVVSGTTLARLCLSNVYSGILRRYWSSYGSDAIRFTRVTIIAASTLLCIVLLVSILAITLPEQFGSYYFQIAEAIVKCLAILVLATVMLLCVVPYIEPRKKQAIFVTFISSDILALVANIFRLVIFAHRPKGPDTILPSTQGTLCQIAEGTFLTILISRTKLRSFIKHFVPKEQRSPPRVPALNEV